MRPCNITTNWFKYFSLAITNKYIWLFSVLLLMWSGIDAQPAKLAKANEYFEEGEYRLAIPLYEEILGREDIPEVKLRLAEAHRYLGNYKASAQWYALVIGLPNSRPEHKFYYGMMLLQTGDCEAAERWFRDYLKYHPYDPRKQRLLNACGYIGELNKSQSGRVDVSLPDFNTAQSELGPAYYGDGVIFSAFRKNPEGSSQAFLDLFQVAVEEQSGIRQYAVPQLFSGSLQSKFHEGIATFNSEETEIYFTRTRGVSSHSPLDPEVHRLEIVTARRLPQGGWSNLKPLPFSSNDYSVAHPSLSSDGKRLFFSSDMPGGQGGKDIYLAFFENGQWGPPINLGPAVNTPDDEVFPFISNSGKLYFSSNGHLGLGGQDIFWTEEGYDGLWVLPYNLGAPFNTPADDFGIIFNAEDTEGYFTSNRSGGRGKDDIYFFRMISKGTPVQVDVVDLSTGDPIPFARVLNSCGGDTLIAGPTGRLSLHLPECCILTGVAKRYQPRSIEACGKTGGPGADTLFIALALAPGGAGTPAPDEEGISADTPRQFWLEGTILNQETGKPVVGAEVQLKAQGCLAPPVAMTNRQGYFSIVLEEGCCYKAKISRDKFFTLNLEKDVCASGEEYKQYFHAYITPYAADPTSDGDGGAVPVGMDAGDSNFEFGRGNEEGEEDGFAFRMNVYYDVDRSSVQEESVSELLRLLKLMQENPEIILEISSHTDSNGSSEYNQRLSQKRAEAIVRYLIARGIEKERLVAKGYGESRLVNQCSDGAPCSEEEHQQNRRTEFRVLGKVQ
ncbi:MAG: OmpA family protein [Phaeodactylibacter sp.]|nr:OmpA family protein [Phaeodactylibacter sp.]